MSSTTRAWLGLRGLSPFGQSALVGLVGLLLILVGSLAASRRAGQAEAMADVRSRTEVVAAAAVEPLVTAELLAGDPEALAALDTVITSRVLDDTTLRVKLWRADGTILYSDEPRLIGERYELDDDKRASLWSGLVVAEVSGLDGPENRFEVPLADTMLEVYLPIEGADGQPVLYESYFDVAGATTSADRIRNEFVPIIIAGLALMQAMHLGLAWGLTRRLRRDQEERERLLQRAIEASGTERRRIAADLHDGVVQDLVGVSFAVSAAAASVSRLGPGGPERDQLAADLRSAAVTSRRSLRSLRSLLVEIYPPNLHQQGLEAALVDLLAPAAELGLETELTIVGGDPPPEHAALVHRVVQESVRNVYRHARASLVEVVVERTGDTLVATVRDDGDGFEPERVPAMSGGPPPAAGAGGAAEHGDGSAADPGRGPAATGDGGRPHFGLRLMTDLSADLGARVTVRSRPGRGTTVRLEVPVP
jgi:signal transduction histidine kinase